MERAVSLPKSGQICSAPCRENVQASEGLPRRAALRIATETDTKNTSPVWEFRFNDTRMEPLRGELLNEMLCGTPITP